MAAQTCKSEDLLTHLSCNLSWSRQPFEPGNCRCLASIGTEFVQERSNGIAQFSNFTKAAKSPGDKILAIVELTLDYRYIVCFFYFGPGFAPIDQGWRPIFNRINATGECGQGYRLVATGNTERKI